ncbi:Gfo/Idh/MocA family protein [Halovulum sp. GXIMD14794]
MIRVAILGAGIGQSHLAAYAVLRERFEVRTVCDIDAERAGQMVKGTGIRVETDLNAVLADPEIDLVDVCLPPHLHFSVSKAAMEAGKHVICEKPLVPSLREADALISVATDSGRQLFPVFQYRYGQAAAQLDALREAGLVGKPYAASIETHWNRGAAYYAVDWRGTWAGENGGAVLGHAIHNHDLLAAIMGPIARLSATVTTRVNPIEVEDCAAILFEMENGAVATSSITLGAANDTTRFRFCFDGLTAESGSEPYAPMSGAWKFFAREPAKQADVDAVLAEVPTVHPGFIGYFDAIADHLGGRPGRAVTQEDGRRSIELVAAIYHASRTGARVSLPVGPENPLYSGWAPAA